MLLRAGLLVGLNVAFGQGGDRSEVTGSAGEDSSAIKTGERQGSRVQQEVDSLVAALTKRS